MAGVGLCHLAFWLDHVDGQIARWRGTASLDGVYYDYLMHHVANLALGFALGFGLAARTGRLFWAPVGFAIAVGWAVLNLHNDCRYKAFFQRLKSSSERYRVDGGAGGRPAPPPSWPRRGRAAISYPLYKACEPHVVLLGLTGLAVLAVVDSRVWLACWSSWALATALVAPLLARPVWRGRFPGDRPKPSSARGFGRSGNSSPAPAIGRTVLDAAPWTRGGKP